MPSNGQEILLLYWSILWSQTIRLRFVYDWYAWRISSDSLDSERIRAVLAEMPEFSADLVGALSRHWKRRSMPKPGSLNVSAYM